MNGTKRKSRSKKNNNKILELNKNEHTTKPLGHIKSNSMWEIYVPMLKKKKGRNIPDKWLNDATQEIEIKIKQIQIQQTARNDKNQSRN